MKYIVALLLSLTLVTACKNKGQNGKVKLKDDFKMSYVQTGCRGFCPAYSYTLDAKGNATYDGTRNVDMTGKYHKNIGADKVRSILEAMQAAGFWGLNDCYGCEVADLPGTVIEVTHAGKTKKVTDYKNAPAGLDDLQKMIEETLGKEGWIAD